MGREAPSCTCYLCEEDLTVLLEEEQHGLHVLLELGDTEGSGLVADPVEAVLRRKPGQHLRQVEQHRVRVAVDDVVDHIADLVVNLGQRLGNPSGEELWERGERRVGVSMGLQK